MTESELKQYREGRYAEMLEFYDKRAIQNKRWYRFFSLYVIVASFLLAPFVAYDLGSWKLLTALMSATIGMAAAALGHFKFHENWLRYRSAWDSLKREPSFHAALIGGYKTHPDANAHFVERVEAIFSGEGADWLAVHAPDDASRKRSDTLLQDAQRKHPI